MIRLQTLIYRHRQKGFTLIELLVVVSIISILTMIAMPNMTLAITRAKISRARNDMRVVAGGLELYMVDHNSYPASLAQAERVTRYNSNVKDIFKDAPFHYETPNSSWGLAGLDDDLGTSCAAKMDCRWILGSVGPDKDWYNLAPFRGSADEGGTISYSVTAPYRDYDATNGVLSSGNVFRTSKNPELLSPVDELIEDRYVDVD